jgi:hypothetical protein
MSLYYKIKNYFSPAPPIEEIFTWKYVDVDNELVEEIKDIYLKKLKTNLQDYEFFQLLPIKIPNVLGQKVIGAGLAVSKGNTIQKYSHKDTPHPDSSIYALNIPLKNCEKSQTNLYKIKKGKSVLYSTYGRITAEAGLAEIAKIQDCDVIASYTLDKPLIFNTQVLHSVNNFSPEPRLAISLRFGMEFTEFSKTLDKPSNP